jgi:hypothetical protein
MSLQYIVYVYCKFLFLFLIKKDVILFSFSQISNHKLLLSLFLFSFLTGCASTSDQGNLEIPQWVQMPQSDNLQSIYGIGEGATLDSAKQSGLKDIASKFSISVASETSNKQSLHNGESDQLFQQRINTQVKDIELTQYELLKTEHSKGFYYVMLSISRPEFIADKRGKLNSIMNSIDIELKNINRKNKVEQLYRYNKVLLLVDQAEPLLHLLTVVDKNFSSSEYVTLFKQYVELEKQLLTNTHFYIHADRKLNAIASLINNALQTHGFQIANKASSDGVIDVSGEITQTEIFSSKNVKINFSVLVKSNRGQVYRKNAYSINGSSVSSYKSAKKGAVQRFENQIKNKSDIYNMFGFNGKS